MDFVEKDNAYEVHADLPGIDEKDIEVKVANGVLTMEGEEEEGRGEGREEEDIISGSATMAPTSAP